MLKYAVFRLAAACVRLAPLRVSYVAACRVGDLAYLLNRSARANVRDNVRHALGREASPERIDGAARAVFRNVVKYYVDVLRMRDLDPRRLDQHRMIDVGFENLTEAVARGRGVVIASAHYGNPELAIQVLVNRGLPTLILTEPLQPPALSRFIDATRSAAGHRFVPATYANLKEAIRTLRSGGIIAVMFDRDIQGRAIVVDVCGAPMSVPVGVFELARRTGSPVVPVFTRRRVDDRVGAVIDPPIDVRRTDDRDADVRAGVVEIFRRFEPYLRAEPGQWLVLERLWDDAPSDGSKGAMGYTGAKEGL